MRPEPARRDGTREAGREARAPERRDGGPQPPGWRV